METEKLHLPMRLQFFADKDGTETEPADGTNPAPKQDPKTKDDKGNGDNDSSEQTESTHDDEPKPTFTQEDVDKAVNQALEKFKQQTNQAKEYEKMNKEERLEYDRQQAQKQAEEAKATLARYQLRDQVRSDASKDGLTLENEDLDQIVADTADKTKANYAWFKKVRDRIKDSVLEDLKKGQPLPGNNGAPVKGSKGEQLAVKNSSAKKSPYWKGE